MKIFYGWVIVGVGIVVSCVAMGAMSSLGIFLPPMAEAMGWSRTGISTAALLNFLTMGAGAFVWGALSDRFGTRLVVLTGGALLGLGMVLASQAQTLVQFQLAFGVLVGLGIGSLFTPLTATTTRWFTEHRSLAVSLVTAGISVGVTIVGPLARWLITTWDWRVAMFVLGDLVWLVVIPAALLLREPPAGPDDAMATGDHGTELTVGQALRTPQFVAIALTFFACCATHAGPIFHMVTHAMDHGVPAMAAATVLSTASLAAAYHRRWEIELAFDELKTHQRGPRMVLRSKSPDLVQQEIWGHLCCHYAIRSLMADAAAHAGHDPDRTSFVAALRIARATIAHAGDFPP